MKLDNWTLGSGLVRRRVALGATAAVMGVTAVVGSGLTTAAHADDHATPTGIVLGVGATETQRVVSWYSAAGTPQVVEVAPTSKLDRGQFPEKVVTFPATVAANSVNGGYNGHAT